MSGGKIFLLLQWLSLVNTDGCSILSVIFTINIALFIFTLNCFLTSYAQCAVIAQYVNQSINILLCVVIVSLHHYTIIPFRHCILIEVHNWNLVSSHLPPSYYVLIEQILNSYNFVHKWINKLELSKINNVNVTKKICVMLIMYKMYKILNTKLVIKTFV